MNDCVNGEIRDVLPELVSGTLPAGEVACVQEHVRACAECAAEVELLRTARAAMRLAPAMDTARIAAAVQASTAQRLAARRAPAARVARVASLSLVAVIGALGIWSLRGSSPTTAEAPVAAAVTAADQPRAIEPARAVESQGVRPPVQLALGGDMSQLGDDELLALLGEVSALEAMPGEEPTSLAIEPVLPVDQEDL
ncbi:MAG: zf-HC2 domain-containing protein [Gemmatimonadaceae bacterium]|nr:zf-HC2 domain-containing protein [Gemmatimonadaceae bacterium]